MKAYGNLIIWWGNQCQLLYFIFHSPAVLFFCPSFILHHLESRTRPILTPYNGWHRWELNLRTPGCESPALWLCYELWHSSLSCAKEKCHYLFQCPLYFQARNKMLNDIRQLRLVGVVVQWLDYLAVTQEPGVRFPATAEKWHLVWRCPSGHGINYAWRRVLQTWQCGPTATLTQW